MTTKSARPHANVERVLVIDDHPLLRVGISKLIGMEPDLELCSELGAGRGALDVVLRESPDVILLDLSLKDCSGLDLIKDFRAAGVVAPILVVSMHDETLYAERALKAGANGYLMKEEAAERVIDGIRSVLDDEIFVSERMRGLMLKRLAGHDRVDEDGPSLDRLTDRELEVFELIGRGLSARNIGTNLGISAKTVDAHRARIREKLGFSDSSKLLRYAVRWVETDPNSSRIL